MRISDWSSDVCSSDLLSPIGYSPTGETFNLRAEELATAVAIAMGADKLMFVTPTNPVQWGLAEGTGDAGQLSWAEGEHLLDNGSLTPVDRSYLQAALAATKGGVKRIHLVGHDDGALQIGRASCRERGGQYV